ncbi:MAG TPA: hypothetical protein PKA82_03955 [Pyrinomonadaceae bacterium]|nr:hypothetical protein [Pyrinomonadaceae bacterium]
MKAIRTDATKFNLVHQPLNQRNPDPTIRHHRRLAAADFVRTVGQSRRIGTVLIPTKTGSAAWRTV